MTLSIIIVSWNVSQLLQQCLYSIFSQSHPFDLDVIVVDNFSQDDSVEMVKRNFPQVKLIENKTNTGFAFANNQGISLAQGNYILLLNPDTEVLDQTLEKSVNFMKDRPDCAVMGCRLLNTDTTQQDSVRTFPTFCSQFVNLLKLHHIFPHLPCLKQYLCQSFDYDKTQIVDQVKGAYFLISKQIIQQVGMLDEDFFIWFEEVDYCKRVKLAGYQVYYMADAACMHHESKSFAQVLSLKKQKMWNASLKHYFSKHHTFLERVGIYLASYVALLLAFTFELIRNIKR